MTLGEYSKRFAVTLISASFGAGAATSPARASRPNRKMAPSKTRAKDIFMPGRPNTRQFESPDPLARRRPGSQAPGWDEQDPTAAARASAQMPARAKAKSATGRSV